MKIIYLLTLINLSYSQLDGGFWWLKQQNNDPEPISKASTTKRSLTNEFDAPEALTKREVVCCECVDFYLCVNGTINNDGAGIFDLRIGSEKMETSTVNVAVCPGDFDVCCKVPDADPSCSDVGQPLSVTEVPESYFTPPPESSCECIQYSSCPADLVVSDGLGKTSMELKNGRMVNHSKCLHVLDVCCYLPDLFFGNDTASNLTSTAPSTPDDTNIDCECVHPILCTSDGYIRTDGTSLIDIRIAPTTPLKRCADNPDLVCCRPPKPSTEETGSGSSSYPPTDPSPTPYSPSDCGLRNFNGIDVRITGFKEGQTQFGEFPWVATLLKKDFLMGKEYPFFLGGASLIHPRVAMTAAHKVKDIPWGRLVVRLGEWDAASTKEILPQQDVGVQEVIFHPGFASGTLFYDVALLILNEEAHHQFHILPICPAKSLDEVNWSSCVINGWGVDEFQSENYQKIMKSVNLPLVPKRKCQTMLQKTRLSKYFRLHPSFICAGGEEGLDACKGDGGGPLACARLDNPSKYVQVGITAWGIGCGMKDVPGVYADVAYVYDWIMDNINTLFPEHPITTSTDHQNPQFR